MTIGRNSRKVSTRSSVRAPKFLDKSSGFYGRLDEPEPAVEISGDDVEIEVKDVASSSNLKLNALADEDVEVFGVIEDDGETLLRRKPSRLSSRWRRSSRRKQNDEKVEEELAQDESASPEAEEEEMKMEIEKPRKTEEETTKGPGLVHFQVREFADDRVLIRDKKRGREEEEEEEEMKMKKEQEEGMKMVKRNTVKNYRKAFDRALRRGWEAFIANLYSVTLTPVKSSSPPPSSPSLKKRSLHTSVLAEFQ